MKTFHPPDPRRGFALLLVLIVVSLAAAVAVLFLLSTQQERASTTSYAQGSRVRQLASQAVNLVMGQINAATKEGTSVSSGQISWASQPGMIRTYTTNGTLSNAYKLYSWDNLIEGGASFNPNAATELPATTWSSQPALYTDLNAPINGVYPIVDPSVLDSAATSSVFTKNNTAGIKWDFPGEAGLITGAAGYAASATNTVPMPVKWLYVLQDGSWSAPTAATGNTVTVANATAANPIVGRIAFWTDDETSKVNVNTASEGSFWDTPKAGTMDEMQFAANPPYAGEFNRVSGHPATTSLSAVFPEMRANSYSRWASGGNSPNSEYIEQMPDILGLTPRIAWGGSDGGTYPIGTVTGTTGYNQTYAPPAIAVTGSLTLDADRLYASADDFWFRQPTSTTATTRLANTAFTDPAIGTDMTPQQLSQRLFFLTAHSRAPETTLFGTPRVSLWPVTWPYALSSFYVSAGIGSRRTAPSGTVSPSTDLSTDPFMAPQERLLAFCSTLNQGASGAAGSPLQYYFQRQDPDSPTYDWSLSVNGDLRNQDMVNYLTTEMGWTPPGMGAGSLATKWGSDNTNWIALNTFDFCRSLINQYTFSDNGQDAAGRKSNYLYTFTGLQTVPASTLSVTVDGASNPFEVNAFTVVPLHVTVNGGTYTSEGAFPSLREATMVFYATQRNVPGLVDPSQAGVATYVANPLNWNNLISWNPATATGASQTTQMQGVMLLSFAQMNPGVFSYRGTSYYSPVFWVKISGSSFQVNGTPVNFPSPTGCSVQYGTLHSTSGALNYLSSTAASLYTTAGAAKTFTNGTNAAGNWSLVTIPITVPASATSFSFTGTPIQVDIYASSPTGNLSVDPTGAGTGSSNPAQLISSQQIDFSQWSGPTQIPLAPRWNVKQATTVPMPDPNSPGTWQPSEIVPTIGQLGSQSTVGAPDPRTPSNYTTGSAATEPLIYAYEANGGTLISTSYPNRLNALIGATTWASEQNGNPNLFGGTQPQTPAQSYQLITPYDVAISMVSDPSASTAGDPRVIGRGTGASGSSFLRIDQAIAKAGSAALPLLVVNPGKATDRQQYHDISSTPGFRLPTGYWLDYTFGNAATEMAIRGTYTQTSEVGTPGGYLLGRDAGDGVIGVEANESEQINLNWDWTAQPGNFPDGGYIVRPDQDYQILATGGIGGMMTVPYFRDAAPEAGVALSENVFIPNRQIPSPVILGTLPSDMNTGWQTLNFCPNPAKQMNGGSHPGVGILSAPSADNAPYSALPDHLMLDLLWMPIAEPYPISEQFSTAGKVNLNYAIMPFPYIQRKTGLDAILKSVCLTAMPSPTGLASTFPQYYKSYGALYNKGRLDQLHTRYPVDPAETLKAFDYKFASGDIFRSASQICDMFLYPDTAKDDPTQSGPIPLVSGNTSGSNSAIIAWWKTQDFTSDNEREDPYSAIYSRVTTKSNTYTVHWKVQALHKVTMNGADANPTTWTEGKDQVSAELRGSTLVERYIDPSATNIPDYATNPNAKPLSYYYKWRVDTENYFQPPP